MTREQMTKTVGDELKHIPETGEHQNFLRAAYNMSRRSLGKKASGKEGPLQVLQSCIASVKRSFPEADLTYDPEFFKG